MDAASILVLILGAGVVVLLVWFEMNSRRNDPSKKAVTSCRRPAQTSRPETTTDAHPPGKEKKIA